MGIQKKQSMSFSGKKSGEVQKLAIFFPFGTSCEILSPLRFAGKWLNEFCHFFALFVQFLFAILMLIRFDCPETVLIQFLGQQI